MTNAKTDLTKVGTSEYQSKKKLALANSPIRRIQNLADIKIEGEKILLREDRNKPFVEVAFAHHAVTDMAARMGIPKKFIDTVENTYGPEGRNKLINQMASGLGAVGNLNLMLIYSPMTKNIIGVKTANHNYITNEGYFKLVEDTMNKYPSLVITRMFADERGKIQIHTVDPNKPHNFGKNEDHLGGLNFDQSPHHGTALTQFLWRQFCANGAMGPVETRINGFSDDSIKTLYEIVERVAKHNFIPVDYGDLIKKASKTPASFNEMMMLLDFMPKDTMSRNKLLSYNEIMQDLRERKIEKPFSLSEAQKKNCKVVASVWDVFNGLTSLASHDHGFQLTHYDTDSIQRSATRLLYKKAFDTTNLVG
jgi:hypothetical protein